MLARPMIAVGVVGLGVVHEHDQPGRIFTMIMMAVGQSGGPSA
jgi:hypothetical protein